MTIHDRIKDLRISHNETQQESADGLKVKRSTWANWESDIVPPADMIIKLADYFEVTTDYLLKGTADSLVPGGKVFVYIEPDKVIDISGLSPKARQQAIDIINTIKALHDINKK